MTDPTDGGNGGRADGRQEPDWYLAEGDRHTRERGRKPASKVDRQANVVAERREFNVVIFYKQKTRERGTRNRFPKGKETNPLPESGKYWLYLCYE